MSSPEIGPLASAPEIRLRASAEAIDRMPRHDLERSLRQLKERRSARTQMEMLNQQTELASLASLELEQAAYELASEAESKGDLSSAARWYTAAAVNDFADASLKLAKIFDALAEKHLHAQEGSLARREELDLVSEACRWYSDALAAGQTEADELLEKLIDRHLGRSRRSPTSAAAKPGPRPGTDPRRLPPRASRMTALPASVPDGPAAARPPATEPSR